MVLTFIDNCATINIRRFNMAEFFELLMVLCFGISWPISIIKTLKTKCVSGKSPLFIIFIIKFKELIRMRWLVGWNFLFPLLLLKLYLLWESYLV